MSICTTKVKLNCVSVQCGRVGFSPLGCVLLTGDGAGKKTAELLHLKEGLTEME